MTTGERFIDTARDRDGLEPRPSRGPVPELLHASVVATGAAGAYSRDRGHPVFPVRVPACSLNMTIGELEPGCHTTNQRHAYEAIMYVLAGRGHSVIEGRTFEWKAGDALYAPPWCWHQHIADPDCRVEYVTATNMPMLESLGQTVMRQEER